MREITKDEAESIGKQLFYDKQFFADLAKAKDTDAEIQRCLVSARHRLGD